MARPPSPLKAFGLLFEEALALAALFDHRQRLVYINPAGAAWLGYSVEELIGQPAVYSSDPQAPSRVSGISPPPEVFQGVPQHGSVISRKAGSPPEHASATFTPLESDVGYSVLVLQTPRAVGIDLTDTDAPCWHEAIHRLRCYQPAEWHHEFLLGNSTVISTFRERLRLLGGTSPRMVLVAEHGCGGEQILPSLRSPASARYVTIDCAVQDVASFNGLLARCKQSGEKLEHGTFALQGVTELTGDVQLELLKAIRSFTDWQWLATTPISLKKAVKQRNFNEELAAELTLFTLRVPPLRERPQDIPLLAQWCVEQHNAHRKHVLNGVLPEVVDHLVAYEWPGNVREFTQYLTTAAELATGPWLTVADLPERLRTAWDQKAHPRAIVETIQLDAFLADLEQEVLRRALAQTRGNKSRAAKLLGISRPRLLRRLAQLKLAPAGAEAIEFVPLEDATVEDERHE